MQMTSTLVSVRQALAARSLLVAAFRAGAYPAECSTAAHIPGLYAGLCSSSSSSSSSSRSSSDSRSGAPDWLCNNRSGSSNNYSSSSSISAMCRPQRHEGLQSPSFGLSTRSFASSAQQQDKPSAEQQRQQLQQSQQQRLMQDQQGSGPKQQPPSPAPDPSDDDIDDDEASKQQQQQGRQKLQQRQQGEEDVSAGQQFGDPHSGISMKDVREMGKGFTPGSLSQEELWLSGVEGRIKIWAARQQPELKGKEKDIAEQVRGEYLQLLTKHAAGRVLSHQARRQLKLACLAIATYRVLMQVTNGREKEVLHHIEQSMGSIYAPFLMGSLKLSSWFRRLLLGQKPIDMAVQTLKDISKDMEGACECQVEASDHTGRLTISSCMFYDIMAAEHVPQLLQFFCCQHNATWLEAYGSQGVKGRLTKCRPCGDGVCEIVVEVPEKGK